MPRPFYGPYEILKTFNEHDSQVLFFMGKLEKGQYCQEKFVGQCVSKDLRGSVWAIAIYMRVIIVCDVRTSKVIWIVDTSTIQTFEAIEQGIRIFTHPSKYKKTKNKTTFLIPFVDRAAVNHIVKKINYVLENIKLS